MILAQEERSVNETGL